MVVANTGDSWVQTTAQSSANKDAVAVGASPSSPKIVTVNDVGRSYFRARKNQGRSVSYSHSVTYACPYAAVIVVTCM